MQSLHDFMPDFCPVKRRLLSCTAAAAARGAVAVGWSAPWVGALAQAKPRVIRIAAASDLKFALARVVALYQQQNDVKIELNFGSSGNFARQILQGLPVDIFMSADEDWAFKVADAGLSTDRGSVYALGRLALLVPSASALPLDGQLVGLRAHWGAVRKLAIANPEHAPYGRAAQQVLQKLGLWDLAKTKLALGENIAQATQFVTSGAAQAGVCALSLAVAPPVAALTRHVAIAENLHAPLQQRMLLLRAASPAAQQLYLYLQSSAVKSQWLQYGLMTA